MHVGHGRTPFTWPDRAQDVDARSHGAVVVRRPPYERKDAAGRERDDASVAVNDLLFGDTTEANPVLDALFEPQKFDLRQIVGVLGIGACHDTILSTSAASASAKTARSMIELVSAGGSYS